MIVTVLVLERASELRDGLRALTLMQARRLTQVIWDVEEDICKQDVIAAPELLSCLSTISRFREASQTMSPTMKVGIVGAGVSGIVAGAHIGKAGIDYTVFERSSTPGGVWSE